MGLCKCPKRTVTIQFCYVHRVNVCEHCIVNDHPTCIVQSYLKWLDDSDYNPVCRICNDQFGTADCIRLVCYDIFHTDCLNDWASRLPPNTAPAGYKCPACSNPVFPASNLVSPVADRLREALAAFAWARTGLELPLIDDGKTMSQEGSMLNGSVFSESESPEQNTDCAVSSVEPQAKATDSSSHSEDSYARGVMQGVYSKPAITNTTTNETMSSSGVRVTAVADPPLSTSQFRGDVHHPSSGVSRKASSSSEVRLLLNEEKEKDADENKYKRRSTIEWFSRWWRTMSRPSSRHHQSLIGGSRRRMIVILVVLGVITIIVVLSYFGHGASDDDPLLDPFNNPNIRIQDK
ncbi:Zinc finger protein-like 1 [Halocaridina rubra]|uniref:Zinc finger protein-like 1 homolog n=1 Tax=Halocaridina rubra TaxID=373956 RepID=A0AAN8ZPF6_HALRR